MKKEKREGKKKRVEEKQTLKRYREFEWRRRENRMKVVMKKKRKLNAKVVEVVLLRKVYVHTVYRR